MENIAIAFNNLVNWTKLKVNNGKLKWLQSCLNYTK